MLTNKPIKQKTEKDEAMKQFLALVVTALFVATLTGCTSLRTPTSGPRANNVYYNTIFGLSIESAVYGDGLIVNKK